MAMAGWRAVLEADVLIFYRMSFKSQAESQDTPL